ncbi:MAG: InlB B-repeat-containing protein [Firmicutes bacterium]|nr:InlB B-repeat-containing protein [Bacillota bacterium]
MKNKLRILLVLSLTVVMSLILVACDNGNDTGNNGGGTTGNQNQNNNGSQTGTGGGNQDGSGGGNQTTPTQFTVTFNTHGGSTIAPQTIASGQTATRPSDDPTRANRTFANWFTLPNGGQLFDFTTPITQNTTIHAQWLQDQPVEPVVTQVVMLPLTIEAEISNELVAFNLVGLSQATGGTPNQPYTTFDIQSPNANGSFRIEGQELLNVSQTPNTNANIWLFGGRVMVLAGWNSLVTISNVVNRGVDIDNVITHTHSTPPVPISKTTPQDPNASPVITQIVMSPVTIGTPVVNGQEVLFALTNLGVGTGGTPNQPFTTLTVNSPNVAGNFRIVNGVLQLENGAPNNNANIRFENGNLIVNAGWEGQVTLSSVINNGVNNASTNHTPSGAREAQAQTGTDPNIGHPIPGTVTDLRFIVEGVDENRRFIAEIDRAGTQHEDYILEIETPRGALDLVIPSYSNRLDFTPQLASLNLQAGDRINVHGWRGDNFDDFFTATYYHIFVGGPIVGGCPVHPGQPCNCPPPPPPPPPIVVPLNNFLTNAERDELFTASNSESVLGAAIINPIVAAVNAAGFRDDAGNAVTISSISRIHNNRIANLTPGNHATVVVVGDRGDNIHRVFNITIQNNGTGIVPLGSIANLNNALLSSTTVVTASENNATPGMRRAAPAGSVVIGTIDNLQNQGNFASTGVLQGRFFGTGSHLFGRPYTYWMESIQTRSVNPILDFLDSTLGDNGVIRNLFEQNSVQTIEDMVAIWDQLRISNPEALANIRQFEQNFVQTIPFTPQPGEPGGIPILGGASAGLNSFVLC